MRIKINEGSEYERLSQKDPQGGRKHTAVVASKGGDIFDVESCCYKDFLPIVYPVYVAEYIVELADGSQLWTRIHDTTKL